MAKISTHILNSFDGTHASNIEILLFQVGHDLPLLAAKTDEGGRMSGHIDLIDSQPHDQYELVISMEPFWVAQNITDRRMKDVVLRFEMPDPNGHYHMPLIVSPNGYSVWISQ